MGDLVKLFYLQRKIVVNGNSKALARMNRMDRIRKFESCRGRVALDSKMAMGLNEELSARVIAAVFEVANVLGAGFLEKVYERALVRELRLRGIRVEAQASLEVSYKGENVGSYLADILVEDELVVELKCSDRLGADHIAQCMNYLRASGKDVCLLVNFQKPRVEWKRILRPGWDRSGSDGSDGNQ